MADPYSMLIPAAGTAYTNPKMSPAGQWWGSQGLNIRGTNDNTILGRILAAGMMPQFAQQMQLGNDLQAKMPGLANQFDPGSRQHLIARDTNAAFTNASRANAQADAANRSAGVGSGTRAGATQGAFNAAATAGNDAARMYNSPEFAARTAQMFQSMGLNPQLASIMISLLSGQWQQKAQKPDGMSAIMGLVGQLAGGGAFNGLFPQHGATAGG